MAWLIINVLPLLRLSKCNKIVSLLRCSTKKKVIVLAARASCCEAAAAVDGVIGCCNLLLLLFVGILTIWLNAQLCQAAPTLEAATAANESVWPPMQHYDIWSADLQAQTADQQLQMELELIDDRDAAERAEQEQLLLQQSYARGNNLSSTVNWSDNEIYQQLKSNGKRDPKVIHLFAVPVDGECLSSDGRRLGNCLNAYECRQKGGQAKGDCAMSFGVCCVFVATCNGTINNNLTYIVSPEFPSFMPSNFTGCQLKVKIMSPEISQLRLDLYHFSLGQPNRRTGVCDGDVFNISGGPSGPLTLCGQNNGQHLYYDVGARSLPRQSTLYGTLRQPANANISEVNASDIEQLIEISINVSSRFLPIRLWEIRVAQIPFSQRAPAGCLQYHTGAEGIMQTFNFADNGRHLANQHYRICVRQESDMCSIIYQPCDEQSFRIGGGGSGGSFMSIMNMATSMASTASTAAQTPSPSMTTTTATTATSATTPTSAATTTMKPNVAQVLSNLVNCSTTGAPMSSNGSSTTAATGAAAGGSSSTAAMTTSMPLRSSIMPAVDESTAASETPSSSASPSPANDDVEGSGDDDNFFFFSKGDEGNNVGTTSHPGVSRRPRPVGGASPSGGFDLLGFLRSALDLRLRHLQQRRHRQSRQFFSTCTDRITMPCIIEDFIGTGFGPLPGCEPVHCGAQFCSSGIWPCRIESTVTPFYIGVHFGDGGAAGKGSAEDNIGACLRYSQVQCI